MTTTPSITTPPAVDTLARQLAEHDAAKRSTVDTGCLQACVDRHKDALGTAPASIDHTPQPLGPVNTTPPSDMQFAEGYITDPRAMLKVDDKGFLCGIGLEIVPATPRRTTRLKMTLHSLTPNVGSADDPLTRCTFGAVYSPNPTEEDGVFGKYTPYGSLSYNVRSDIAAHLEQGKAYYVDITEADL